MMTLLRPAIVLFMLFTALTGVVYPFTISSVALLFPSQANGSLIMRDGQVVGSSLIGQEFTDPAHFWGRPSATSPVPYSSFNAALATGSSGSNLGPTNPALLANVQARIDALKAADEAVAFHRPVGQAIPADLVTSSASGLDPHITPAAAEYQIPRIAQARGVDAQTVRALVQRHTRPRQWGMLGEPVVNVLELNLALDAARF